MTDRYNFPRADPGNPASIYLAGRIDCDNYRGSVSSQHNRYTMAGGHGSG
ncbi:hypothetical protein CENSYa_0890 [Cenarchaeum symbiosum A]|uniref:Uncharacterized protein n=1 Tax=Cenarchaeum symbiosum (strain A) TaxID=414004 RepID=A0RW05_CENSY|nr:hypothetical protein CENSYa_0890 [Cenarchaeum symbiosum A]